MTAGHASENCFISICENSFFVKGHCALSCELGGKFEEIMLQSRIRRMGVYVLNYTKSVDETLVCDLHSNESFFLSCGTVNYAVQGGSNFESVDETLVCGHSNESY